MPEDKEIILNDEEKQLICVALIERIKVYKKVIEDARRNVQTVGDRKQLFTYIGLLHSYERAYATMKRAYESSVKVPRSSQY